MSEEKESLNNRRDALWTTYLRMLEQAVEISNQLSEYGAQGHVEAVRDYTARLARKNEQLEGLVEQLNQSQEMSK